MGFRSIGDLAISVLAKLDIEATEEGCAVEAHSLRPATGNRVATGSQGEEPKPVAFAQSGEGTAEQTGMRKMAEPGSPAKLEVQEERQSEDNRGSKWSDRRLSNRKHTLTVLPAASASRHVSSARPTRCVGSHLKLVWSDGHMTLANSP